MKFDFENWCLGGRIIFVTSCVATLSMLMKWVDIGIISQTGLSQGTFLFLGFWIYPLLMLFKNKPIVRAWGLVCSIGSVIVTFLYIESKTIEMFDETVNAAATGAWLFLLASIALIVGIVKYCPPEPDQNIAGS